MKNYRIFFLITFVFFFLFSFFFSCERVIPEPGVLGDVEEIELADPNTIPVDFGQLVSITSPRTGTAHLWFQDENFTIRVVQINYGKGKIDRTVRVIKRK